jgi:hypothetical protein
MTPDDASRVSALHGDNPSLTAEALCFEYFKNPDPNGKLFYALNTENGSVAATQAFVSQTLIKGGRKLLTLMSERTLLAPSMRGKSNFTAFYAEALSSNFASTGAPFVWGGTAAVRAFQKFGFEAIDCFFEEALTLRPGLVLATAMRPASVRSRVFHTGALAFSLLKSTFARALSRRPDFEIDEERPSAEMLEALVVAASAAHPDSYFFYYTLEKLDWLVDSNPHRHRRALYLRRDGELVGLAIIEDFKDGFATVIDLLVRDTERADLVFRGIGRDLISRGFAGMKYWGNGQNGYVSVLRKGFRRLGSVRLPVHAQLVIKGSADVDEGPPQAHELAMTQIWAPPA